MIAAATIAMTISQRMFVSNVTTSRGYPLLGGGNNPLGSGFESPTVRNNREPHEREE